MHFELIKKIFKYKSQLNRFSNVCYIQNVELNMKSKYIETLQNRRGAKLVTLLKSSWIAMRGERMKKG